MTRRDIIEAAESMKRHQEMRTLVCDVIKAIALGAIMVLVPYFI